MSLFWKCPTSRNKRQVACATFAVIHFNMGKSIESSKPEVAGAGCIPLQGCVLVALVLPRADLNTQRPLGEMVLWSSYRSCVWRTWPSHGAILLLCHGNKSTSRTFHLSFPFVVCHDVTQSSSVSHTTRKNLSCLNNFCLAVHQITLGSRPDPAVLVISIYRKAVPCI